MAVGYPPLPAFSSVLFPLCQSICGSSLKKLGHSSQIHDQDNSQGRSIFTRANLPWRALA
jgi:hypothetical protein